jgi:hypothetical protein
VKYENIESEELLHVINWTDEQKLKYNFPSKLNINYKDLDLFKQGKSANEMISKLYYDNNELLFLILYTDRIINMSGLVEVFVYNINDENPDFIADEFHEHSYLSDVQTFLIRTNNKIYIFGMSTDEYYNFEEIVIEKNGYNMDSKLTKKTIERLNIKGKNNFEALLKIVEKHSK